MKQKKQKQMLDLIPFINDINREGRTSLVMGFLILIASAVLFGYIGTKRVQYADQFYNLKFSFTFLEGLAPGAKIRFQGSLIVGEVQYIETRMGSQLAHAKLKKSFKIPKTGSRASLQTWGYFGGKFLNIDVLGDAVDTQYYKEGEIVPAVDPVNSTVIMKRFGDYIEKDMHSIVSPLEEDLQKSRQLSKMVAKSPYSNPRYVRSLVKAGTGKATAFFEGLNNIGKETYSFVEKIDTTGKETIGTFKKNIPELSRQMKSWKNHLGYERETLSAQLLHEEVEYYKALNFIIMANEKLANYKVQPYRIFFEK